MLQELPVLLSAAAIILACVSYAQASDLITVKNVSASGDYYNSLSLLTDGVVPDQYTDWLSGTNVHWGDLTTSFTLDFGSVYKVTKLLLSVDNNDAYQIQYSLNGTTWSTLYTINIADGTVTESEGGTDTFSILLATAVDARYLRVMAIDGDGCYAIGEIQASGTSVPVPATLLLLAPGLLGMIGARRKFKK